MQKMNRWVWIASIALVSLGVISFILNVVLGYAFNIGWPLLVVLLGAAFLVLAGPLSATYRWADFLFIPGGLLAALGLIFLLNVLTGDWNAWAYAWLLALAGLGAGVLLANRSGRWPQWVTLTGMGLTLGGITLAVLFGAITGGLFIQVMAPLALVLVGVGLRWLKPEKVLARLKEVSPEPVTKAPNQAALVEPLSARELDVLRLIAEGLSNAEIAGRLTLAQSTVKTHINNIYGKLGVQTRIAAIQRARELHLL